MLTETKAVMNKTRKWEAAWTRYIESLKRCDEARANPDGRVLNGARRSLKAARRQLDSVRA